jgi:hypothetical protein
MNLHKYTEQELRDAVKNSTSKRKVLQKLGVVAAGGNYATLKKAIKYFDLDTSHFTGQGWNKGQNFGPKRPLSDYLSNKYCIGSDKLRRRLIREGIFNHKCSDCELTEWKDSLIPLELDHINGDRLNNNLSNLRLLCPNCHAFTPTYRGKNKGKNK